jgi:LuxR family maltose regulon positive regulatory protein
MTDAPEDARHHVPRTKLAIPELPPRLVSRPRLLAKLDRTTRSLVTLVSAPAGAGKTLLLAEWVRDRGVGETAWVSLDSDDNDDRRFWSALLDGLSTAMPRGGPLTELAVPSYPSTDQGFLAEVVDALDDMPVPVLLVLDDVHELSNRQCLRGLEALLPRRLGGLRLILSSRTDPHLPLTRLRLADELSEIRGEDLKFSVDEARTLLDTAGLELNHDQLRRLLEQTEGWAAGLRLATLSLSDTTEPDQFLADFASNDRAVAEYLIEEVLSRLPEQMRQFLSTISISEHTSTELAAHLSGRLDAAAMLDAIAERTSMVSRADASGHNYHVHALLRSHLLADLVRQAPERAASLHGTAADWYAERDEPARALAHAVQAGNDARTMALLHWCAVDLSLGGNHTVVREALDALDARSVVEDSLLALVSALMHLERGDLIGAERDLTHAETAWPDEPSPELETLCQVVRSRHVQLAGDVDELVRVTEDLDAEPGPLEAVTMLQRGTALLGAGRHGAAREQLTGALRAARRGDHDYVALQSLTMLSGLAAAEGDYGRMVKLATIANVENARRGLQHTMGAAITDLVLGYGALLYADPAECAHQMRRAARVVDQGDPSARSVLRLPIGVLLGMAEFDLGDHTRGARRIHAARLAAGDARFPRAQIALCAIFEHRTALLLGLGPAAGEVLRWAQANIPDAAEVRLIRAKAQFALGRSVAAGKVIQPVLDGSARCVLAWSVIEAWLVAVEVALSAGDHARARRALERALSAAERLDAPYPVVFAAPEIVDLMTSRLGSFGAGERFAQRVFALRHALRVPPPVPLTARERTVLRMLPTLRSFDEIAADLTVSANTVKTHVRSIYTKLGVSRRRDAVAVAIERGLLENTHADSD